MMVANGEADAMMFVDSWTHKWDSCAGEAIIKSMGGCFTTTSNSEIVYNPYSKDTHNKEGMVVTLDKDLHERCLSVLTGSKAWAVV